MSVFFTKYTATHEKVTRSAPSRETNDTKIPYVNTKKRKKINVAALPAKKGNKLIKADKKGGKVGLVRQLQIRGQKLVNTESSV